ncbi:MAG: PepSY domain-containing protein [Neisseriaceae bacterium]|nr:PepSY domain-containing protein [Neisseriaceae bacterium]
MKHLTSVLILTFGMVSIANAQPHTVPVQQHNPPTVQHQYRQNHQYFEQNNQNYISHQKAAEIALQAFEKKYRKKGFVEDVDFEHKLHGNYYEVEIEDGRDRDYEVRVDAKTGKVLYIKRDY